MLTADPPEWLIILFAVGAAVVVWQLYNVLGRKVGRQPSEGLEAERARLRGGAEEPGPKIELGGAAQGAAAIKARDPNFDASEFLEGARTAYATIVRAFRAGDRDALRPLLSPAVMEVFEGAMAAREAEGRTESVEFLHPPRADLESLEVVGDIARATVRFLSELRTRSKGPEGEAVDDRRTSEFWTFERKVPSPDPNWVLVHVEEAKA